MEIRYLNYFVVVAEKRSFTKAAEQLHISQPSLSSAIKNMEKSLDLKLIERSTKEFRLTEEGELLYQEAKKLIRHHENVLNELENVKKSGVGEFSIGLIESSMLWLPDLLNQFKENFPHVKVKLLEVLSLEEVEEALWNYEIHLAITNQFIHREEIETAPVYRERLVALFPPQHPLTEKPYIHLSDLAEEPFIVSREGFQTREDILKAFREVGIVPNIQFEIERFETATRLVEENLGVTMIPENYVKYAKSLSANARPIQDFPLLRTVYLAFEKNRYLPPTASGFIDLVKNYFEKD
ncbi:LysR family transcriptional regulator [Fervidibacillus halotolerans]|uniref:LysR family transcriptional regulator n=1 Tax=Fervidibacillus halotolerans TaxID=2980027 RepID=A0A9E8M0Y5_9BACI|nr:LysR family transcriptional regulator [Fervidibacillus halotolerans]WAA13161.1 LysR family transcriptional regulator [Fervidibacillus halotolerans]